MTQGLLDPTSLPVLRLWDYKAEKPRVPTDAEIAAARALVGWKKCSARPERFSFPSGHGTRLRRLRQGIRRRHGRAARGRARIAMRARGFRPRPSRDRRAAGPARMAHRPRGSAQARAAAGSIAVVGKGVASSGDYLRCFVVDG